MLNINLFYHNQNTFKGERPRIRNTPAEDNAAILLYAFTVKRGKNTHLFQKQNRQRQKMTQLLQHLFNQIVVDKL